jgi:endonuclease YncB( thermonuclease family)
VNEPPAARKAVPPLPRPGLAVLLLLAWALAPAAGAAAERLAGTARVVDGDTLDVAGIHVRLEGVAAPELHEAGGDEARAFVAGLAEGRTVVCERTRGRRVGYCRREGRDVGAEVIAAGLARDCPRYSGGRYAAAERPEASRRLPFPSYCRPR